MRSTPEKSPERPVRTTLMMLSVGVSCVLVAGVAAAVEVGSTPDGVLVRDGFSRSVASGFGRADAGGSYTSVYGRLAKVAGGTAKIAAEPGHTTRQYLNQVSVRDSVSTLDVVAPAVSASGNGLAINLEARGSSSATYAAKFRFMSGKRVATTLIRLDKSGEKAIVADKVVAAGVVPGDRWRLEFKVDGTSKVTLSSRAHRVSAAPPAWQLTGVDTSSARLTGSGAPGIRVYLSSATPAVAVQLDDYVVREAVAPAPAPVPPPTTKPSPTQAPVPTTRPTTAPTAKPTTTPTTAPPTVAPTPGPAPVPGASSDVGSLPVGSASYVVPVGAVFVAASGSSGGSGSQSDPFGSLGAALAKVKSGSTLVLRGGSYHESVRVPFNKKVTIQPYPGEAVWLDGTVPVTGWQKSGSSWFVSGWNHNLDSRVSFNSAADQSDWFVDPKYPMAGHPDQVWIGGQRLAEVGSAAAVKPGTFFVDTAAKRLVVGSDPTSKQVRASVLQRALQIQGEGTIVRGIGVRRYANTLHLMGAVTAEVHDLALENMVITENATVGLYGWNDRHRFRRLTITDNGMLGFGHAGAKDMVLTESIVSGNNSEHFNGAPVAGGIKIGRSTGVTVSANLVRDNINSSGIWLDESVKGATVVANTVRDNDTTGIMAEISDNVVIADNHVTGNRGTGIWS
ncbi:right-handed parallel beta-helix repeat-containing protein, partial [Aeromicrobium sp. 636]